MTSASGLVVVLTSINAAERKWSWDLAIAQQPSSGAAAAGPISHAKLLSRSANSPNTFAIREEALMFYAPNTWVATLEDAQISGSSVTVSDAVAPFLDKVFATGVISTDATTYPKGLKLNPAFSAGFSASPFSLAAGAPSASGAAPAVASDIMTIKDKLENKFAFTVSISAVKKFKAALEQRIISLPSRYVPPATLDRNTDEGMALLYYHYITDEFWKHSERLGGVKKSDYEDWQAKEVAVFRSKKPFGKGDVVINAYAGNSFRWMVALTNADIHAIIKTGAPQSLVNLSEKKVIVGKAEGPWTITADAVANAAAGPNALDIKIVIQPRSATEATCFTVPIEASALPTEEGDIILPAKVNPIVFTKGTNVDTIPANIASYALPPTTATGPILADVPLIKCVHQPETVEGGEAAFKLEAKDVKAGQSITSGPTFNNYFTAALQLTNPKKSQECISATKVTMAYKNFNGEWVDMQDAKLVVSGWGDNMQVVEENIDLGEVGAAVIGVKAHVTITGACGSDNFERARAHRTLPQPLDIRVTVSEVVSGAVHTIEMQQANSPLKYESEEEVRHSWISSSCTTPMKLFVFADDADAGRRHFAGCYVDEKKGFVVRHNGRYVEYSADDMHGVAYQAAKAGTPEYEISSVGSEHAKFYALVDIKATPKPVWYGVRVDMKTATSSSSAACHVALE